jgi:probable HAF family extracellular repeat protein
MADFNLTGGGYHASVYTNGVTVDLGSLGQVSSHSADINDLGQVTGFFGNSVVADEGNIKKPFLYSGGVMHDLSSIIVASMVWPYAINNSGQVVGFFDPKSSHRPFLYSGGQAQDLGFDGVAYDINDAGQIVGHEYVAGGNHAYLLSGGVRTPLGTLGGNDTSAIRINNNGLIAGNSQLLNGSYHGFLHTGGQMHDLGTLGGAGSGVHGLNNNGQIVGSSDTSGGAAHAYLYRNGEILDLNDLIPQNTGWILSYAMDINDNGLIVGGGKKDGVSRAFLLVPNATNAPLSNQVLSLAGNGSYVTVPSAPDLQNPTEITVEAWIRPQQASQNNPIYINKSDNVSGGSSRSYELQWVDNADSGGPGKSVRFIVFLNNGSWAVVSSPAPEGKWVHVAGCFASGPGVLQLFTNGVLAATSTTDSGGSSPLAGSLLRQTTLPLQFGRGDFAPYYYAHGFMDEIRIWNSARSQAEIQRDIYKRLSGATTNLVGYWNFDDGTANDQTGHGHNGTIVGSAQVIPMDLPMQITPPVVNQRVLTLNGNADYVTIPGSTALKATNEITIESWIYPVPNNNNPNAFFMSKGAGPNLDSPRTFELSWTPDNRAYFSLFTGQSTWSLLGAPAAESQWTHIAATFNGSDGWFRLYTNGILAAATTNDVTGQFPLKGQSLRENSLPLVLGCSFNGAPVTGTFATGQMDEVRIWNRALSGPEILQNISRRLSGTELNLVAYWNFDNGTANDGTSENHNGTLSGNAETVAMEGFDIIHDVIGVTGTSFSRRGEIVLDIAARNGVYIRVDASTNMVEWKPIGTNQVVGGTIQFLDPDTLKYQQRFYRAVLQ